jgi:flagellar hook-associated protein 3 FlgL
MAEAQAKLATGEQLLYPSDDVSKSNLIASLKSAQQRYAVYTKNLDEAESRFSTEESVLSSMTRVVQRLEELAIQGGSDTLGATDRDIIAAEIGALKTELLRLGNTTDINGNYIFSGNKFDEPTFIQDSSGVVQYGGDFSRFKLNVSDVRQLQLNTLGPELMSTEDFAAIDNLIEQLSSDNGEGVREALDEISGIGENLTVSYAAMGSRASAIESQREVIEESQLRFDQLLMKESDLDYAKAVTELTKESLALQAIQASFAKITQLSLFDYVR